MSVFARGPHSARDCELDRERARARLRLREKESEREFWALNRETDKPLREWVRERRQKLVRMVAARVMREVCMALGD